jgi:RHS repeat-associated protein
VPDGQSHVVALTNQSGSGVDNYSYDQWGRPISISQSVPQQLRYNGYWYDTELGWYWHSVRTYEPMLGHCEQPDPSEKDGLVSCVYAPAPWGAVTTSAKGPATALNAR